MKVIAVIPARYTSTRLPGKPLADICGKPMIQHVYELISRAEGLDDIVVATDDARIADAVRAFGGKVFMTSPDCQSGSDRVREVASSLAADIYINVQGDEPLLEPSAIEKLLSVFRSDGGVRVATLCSPISEEPARSPHQVKVVCDDAGNALYFSRSLMPYPRNKPADYKVYKHVGIYAYRRNFLLKYAALAPTPLERTESLEQLRVLENGYKIKVLESDFKGVGVDTPEDLAAVNELMAKMNK